MTNQGEIKVGTECVSAPHELKIKKIYLTKNKRNWDVKDEKTNHNKTKQKKTDRSP